ncbi:MAG: excinuclease ABC subunit UvrC [Clostridia bacterium]|nr:excinuclease ABC subunit UvrC [Clostridia bacterium]
MNKILEEKLANLPTDPGCYLMKNKDGKIIYVGKAKNLKNRVSSYFQKDSSHSIKVRKMVNQVYDFELILADSEFEALILECHLIKLYSPKYNILLKDDRGYSYIEITDEKWPRLNFAYRKENNKSTYIGPYISTYQVKRSVAQAKKIFKLPSCNKNFSRQLKRPCLDYFIGLCKAPCCGYIDNEEYLSDIESAKKLLSGKNKEVLKKLEEQMLEESEKLNFESAAKLRDNIQAIKSMSSSQKVVSGEEFKDVIATAKMQDKISFFVISFEYGVILDTYSHITDIYDSDEEMLAQFIKQFYFDRENIPPVVNIEFDIPDIDLMEKFLNFKSNRKVKIHIPKIGDQRKLILMAKKNARQKLLAYIKKDRYSNMSEELGIALGLDKQPQYIEAYDISHTATQNAVGVMVVYENGKPKKSNYRKFNIKTATSGDDAGSIYEVLYRRFGEHQSKERNDSAFNTLPDLILIDGGMTQADAAIKAIKDRGIENIPVFAMKKDKKHRTDMVTDGNKKITLRDKTLAFNFIAGIQEEVHRFAITFHKSKRDKIK